MQWRAKSSASFAVQSPRGFCLIASHQRGVPTFGAQLASVKLAATTARAPTDANVRERRDPRPSRDAASTSCRTTMRAF